MNAREWMDGLRRAARAGIPARVLIERWRRMCDAPQRDGPHRISGWDYEDRIARAFHEAYERLAPKFGYRTREASAVSWEDVPDDNKRLMRATVRDLLNKGVIR